MVQWPWKLISSQNQGGYKNNLVRINYFNQQELQTYLCFIGLCFTKLQILSFVQIEGLCQSYIYQCYFPTALVHLSLCHILVNSHNISNLFTVIIFVTAIRGE